MSSLITGRKFEIVVATVLTLAALVILTVRMTGASETKGELSVSKAWARPSMGDTDKTAVYLTIDNAGAAGDRLTGVRTSVSKNAEIHETRQEDGVMKMRHLEEGVAVPAEGTFVFEPAGHHIMLLGLERSLEKGETFPLTLEFEKAGEVEVPVSISMTPPANGGH